MDIDYDALKRRGFLRQKQEGYFLLRLRATAGTFTADQLQQAAALAKGYGREIVHATTRQGLEIPFIRYEAIDAVEAAARTAGLETGTSGPRLRTTTCCPGSAWCKSGLIDTVALASRLEQAGVVCGVELPHKFKVTVSGCPNACTRAEAAEVGIHGAWDAATKARGCAVYVAGCGGRTPRPGHRLPRLYTPEQAVAIVLCAVAFFRANAKPRQRLALLVEEIGLAAFLERSGIGAVGDVPGSDVLPGQERSGHDDSAR